MNELETQLFTAVNSGSPSAHNDVEDLTRRGVNINCTNNVGQNALHYALLKMSLFRMKEYRVVDFLINAGININHQDSNGETPLHMAARNNLFRVVDQLMATGADVTLLTKTGESPLNVCLRYGSNCFESAKIIMKDPRAIKVTSPNGFTVLHQVVTSNNLPFIKEVIAEFKDVNIRTIDGYAPVHAAVVAANLPALQELVSAGADLLVADKEGKFPVHIAASSERLVNILHWLVENFPCVNLPDANGNTPLYYAITNHFIRNTAYLIQKGADITFRNKLGQNLLISLFFDDKDVKSLRYNEPGISNNLLEWKEIIGQLLDKGIDINDTTIDGPSLAWGAFNMGLYDIFYYFVERGADINRKSVYGASFLTEAVKKRNMELVKYLIGRGIDINLKDQFGHDAYFSAVESNNLEMLNLLDSNKNLIKEEIKLDTLDFDSAFNEIQKLINAHTYIKEYGNLRYPVVSFNGFVAGLAKWDVTGLRNVQPGIGVQSMEYFTPRYYLKLSAVAKDEDDSYDIKIGITAICLYEQKPGGLSKGFNIKEQ